MACTVKRIVKDHGNGTFDYQLECVDNQGRKRTVEIEGQVSAAKAKAIADNLDDDDHTFDVPPGRPNAETPRLDDDLVPILTDDLAPRPRPVPRDDTGPRPLDDLAPLLPPLPPRDEPGPRPLDDLAPLPPRTPRDDTGPRPLDDLAPRPGGNPFGTAPGPAPQPPSMLAGLGEWFRNLLK